MKHILFVTLFLVQASAFASIDLELDDEVVSVKDTGAPKSCAVKLAREVLEYASDDFDHLKIEQVLASEKSATFKMVDASGKVVYLGELNMVRENGKCVLSKHVALSDAETKTKELEWNEKVSHKEVLDLKKYSF